MPSHPTKPVESQSWPEPNHVATWFGEVLSQNALRFAWNRSGDTRLLPGMSVLTQDLMMIGRY
jgi:hypothetical protein